MDKKQTELFEKGIEEFNSGLFFECHETLEELWTNFEGFERNLIQGLIQISVGYLHLTRNNSVGAQKLFKKGLGRIDTYPDGILSIRILEFSQAVQKTVKILNAQDNLAKSGHIVGTENFFQNTDFPLIKFEQA